MSSPIRLRHVITFLVWTYTSFLCHKSAKIFIDTLAPPTDDFLPRAALDVMVTFAQIGLRHVITFLVWTYTSFLCHKSAKIFIDTLAPPTDDFHLRAAFAVMVTWAQIALCYLSTDVENKTSYNWMVKISHVMATLATNISLASMYASSALAIKLMEPITSVLVQYVMVGKPLSPVAIFSLPIIVGGAIVFTGNPFSATQTLVGVISAFVSNVILGFRNVFIKQLGQEGQIAVKIKSCSMTSIKLVVALGGMVALTLTCFIYTGQLETSSIYASLMLTSSSVFHVTYSYVSTGLVLKELSVVSHAVANILKRVLVVLMLYVAGSRVGSGSNWLGLVTCVAGLGVYTWDKLKTGTSRGTLTTIEPSLKSQAWTRYAIPVLLFVCLCSTMVIFPNSSMVLIKRFREAQIQYTHTGQPVNLNFRSLKASNGAQSPVEDSVVYSNTFGPRSFQRPTDEELLPDLSPFSQSEQREISQFLTERLINSPERANFLSQKLTTHAAIIKEAQRLHFNILGDALKKYKYSILFDIAAFENKGDPAITVGEILFLSRINLPVIYTCKAAGCSEKLIDKARDLASKYSMSELVVLVHGGGNIIGYARLDESRFKIMKKFKGYDIFVFPQSIWVKDVNHPHVKKCKLNYCCNANLTIVLRDLNSYKLAKEHFNGSTKLIMAPDMAFQIGHVHRILVPVFDVMWIKRKDGETPGYKDIPEHPKHLLFHVSDWSKWITPGSPLALEKAFYITTNGFFYLQRGRVVVTDRLHGHILSTLMNIPHVIIDNKYKKLSSYHNTWMRSLENTLMTSDPTQGVNLSMKLLKRYDKQIPPRIVFSDFSESFQKYNFKELEFNSYI